MKPLGIGALVVEDLEAVVARPLGVGLEARPKNAGRQVPIVVLGVKCASEVGVIVAHEGRVARAHQRRRVGGLRAREEGSAAMLKQAAGAARAGVHARSLTRVVKVVPRGVAGGAWYLRAMHFAKPLTVSMLACSLLGLAACGDGPTQGEMPDAAVGLDATVIEFGDAGLGGGDDAGEAPLDAHGAGDGGSIAPGTISVGPSARPASLVVPPAHDGSTRLPLVVLLHGYSASAAVQDAYFGTSRAARVDGFYLLLPDGTPDTSGNRFWNAGACCDLGATGVDDVGYLTGLLDTVEATVPVDTSRVYFIGHSNGGFMSYRMACELGDRITALASLAGTEGVSQVCEPSGAVSVLHMHGTLDATVLYSGGLLVGVPYIGAEAEVAAWRTRNGCSDTSGASGPHDYDTAILGPETDVTTWSSCDEGSVVELWRMNASSHTPVVAGTGVRAMLDWLFARRGS